MKLKEHPLLAQVDPHIADQLAESATIRNYAPNEVVFEEGSAPDAMFLILEGKIEFQKKVAEQKHQTVNHNGPGDCFGELGVLQDKPRFLRAIAVEPTTLARISAESVFGLGQTVSGGLVPALLRHITNQLKTTTEHYVRLALENERRVLVGTMVNTIIHDFKSPFSAIRMAVGLIQSNHDDPKTRRMCGIIEGQIDRMLSMADDLLEYSRGQTQLKCGKVDVTHLFTEFMSFNEALFKERHVQVEMKPAPAFVWGDGSKLHRVLQNLVYNAVEAAEGQPDARVTLEAKGRDDRVIWRVTDNGEGIPEEIRDRFFEAFVTCGKRRGTGLGTAIVKSVVEAHGGRVYFETKTGHGTTVTVELLRAGE